MSTDAAGTVPTGRGYTKVKDIGQGSYGKAVLVQDRDGKLYVMKVIDMSRMDSKQRKDAINEVKVLSSLKHPYVVSYRESFTESRNLAIVMDYADGGDLHQRITRTRQAGKTFPEERVIRWFTEATLALKYLHDRHVLHRDLKTSNLFLTSQDRLRIGDFGISKVLESTVAFAKTTIGTPYYLSPEICMERPYSFSSDIWALGCVLYELAALRVPFDAQSLQALVQKITRGPTPSLPSSYSPELRQLGADLLHREQTTRPSAPEILQRTIVQQEIRRMLREEQAKGSARTASEAGAGAGVGGGAGAVPGPAVHRRGADGASDRGDIPLKVQKSPSLVSDGEAREYDYGGGGGISARDCDFGGGGVMSARHHAAAALPHPLKGVGASVCMMDDRNMAALRGREPAIAVAAGVPSRHGTPGGMRRRF